MKHLIAAIQFLTIFPVPASFNCGEKELRGSVVFFPIVGLLIGGFLAILDFGIVWIFPPLPASVLVVILMLAASGCLHMDGLADTADGFLSARPKERVLEIMRDSRIGSMGAIAIVSVIALKVAALASIPGRRHWMIVLLMPIAGRCALVVSMAIAPYARETGGLVSAFGRTKWPVPFFALLFLAMLSWAMLGIMGLVAAAGSIISTFLISCWSKRKIGGFTGDTLGAACEIAEAVLALIASSWRWLL
jgi:adenosylcobinamide-GDP ribazoletransferase